MNSSHTSSLASALCVVAPLSFNVFRSSTCVTQDIHAYFAEGAAFHVFGFAILVAIGVLLLSSGNRHGFFATLVDWFAPRIGQFYSAIGGATLGWIFGVCAAFFARSPAEYSFSALVIMVFALLFVLSLLALLSTAVQYVSDLRGRWERPLLRIRMIQIVGIACLTTSAWMAWQYLFS